MKFFNFETVDCKCIFRQEKWTQTSSFYLLSLTICDRVEKIIARKPFLMNYSTFILNNIHNTDVLFFFFFFFFLDFSAENYPYINPFLTSTNLAFWDFKL